MNKNPGETPNPLNPTPEAGTKLEPDNVLDANPSEPMSVPEQPVQTEAAMQAESAATETISTEKVPTEPVTQTTETFAETVQVASLDPAGRPMEKVVPQVEEPKKKNKVGLIATIVILLVALICGGVAAALILINKNKPDAVAVAMSKLMSGEAPANVAIDGNIDILLDNKTSAITRVNINLDSDIIVGSAINTSSAVLTMTTQDNKDYSVKFNEVYAANGDLYFKIDGAMAAIEDSGMLNLIQNNTGAELNTGAEDLSVVSTTTETTETGEMIETVETVEVVDSTDTTANAAYTKMLTQAIEVIDGEWLKISTDELAQLSSGIVVEDSPATCIINMVGDLNKNSNSTIQLYNKYPFINSSTEGVMIASKENPVYRVTVDSENFAKFVNAMNNAGLANNLYSCLQWDGHVNIGEEDVAGIVSQLPKAYVEVNGNNEFSRLYIDSELNDGTINVVMDLGLSYPRNVNVMEPVEYRNFSDVIQKLMSGMFSISENTNETVVITE